MNISYDKPNWLLCPVSRLPCAVCVFFFSSSLLSFYSFRCIGETYYWNWELNQINTIVIINLDRNGGDRCVHSVLNIIIEILSFRQVQTANGRNPKLIFIFNDNSHFMYAFLFIDSLVVYCDCTFYISLCHYHTSHIQIDCEWLFLWNFSVHKCQRSRWSRWIFQNIAFHGIICFFFFSRYHFLS